MENKILIIEGKDNISEIIINELKNNNLNLVPISVNNPESLIKALDELKPGIIISDYQLNGFDIDSGIFIVRQKVPEAYFLILSENVPDDILIELLKRGADEYIHKSQIKKLPLILRKILNENKIKSRYSETEERLKNLSKSLLNKIELERRHIARELHDEIGQILTAIKIKMQSIQKLSNLNEATKLFNETITTIDHAIQQIRNLSLNLRPSMLDDLGLPSALRWLVNNTIVSGYEVEFSIEEIGVKQPIEIETACFRIAQEALNNILKHSNATKVKLNLIKKENLIELIISDNGKGFDVEKSSNEALKGKSFGLIGMHERALLAGGSINIKSEKGIGTEIRAYFPLKTFKPNNTDST